MRVFLCSYGNFSIAIPMSSVSSLALHTDSRDAGAALTHDRENTYVSLPKLFELPSEYSRHGITLNSGGGKIVLLSTEVEREAEIPDEEIFPVPKALCGTRFSALFSGIQFAGSPVLLLDPERLIQRVEKEMAL